MRKHLFIIYIILQSIGLSAQDGTNYLKPLQDIVPKTPEAAALSKYVDIPPGNYTGTSNVSVPIYNINAFGLSLPISIDYHVSGIRVGQTSSRIGLGWVANIGNASLSKQIVGHDDVDHIMKYNVNGYNIYNIDWKSSEVDYLTAMRVHGCGDFEGINGVKDTQPDIFSFNLNGMSGKFVKDSSDKIHMIPYNAIKVTRSAEFAYIFTTTDGVQYKFKNDAMQFTIGGNGSNYNGRTNYKISEIELLNGEKITFNYRNINYQYLINNYHGKTIDVNGNFCSAFHGQENFELNYANNTDGLLTEIIFPNGKVIFKYSDEKSVPEKRKDIVNDVYCIGIKVQDKSETVIKNYQFNQSYFESSGYQANPLTTGFYTTIEPMKKALYSRLKLSSIQELVSNTKHTFEYNETNMMPNRFSFSTDYWGFYNGAPNINDLPKTLYNNKFYGDANKEPNLVYGKSLSLEKVIFPTGGFQTIEYENDDFFYNGLQDNYEYNQFEINTVTGSVFNRNYPFTITGSIDQRFVFNSDPNQLDTAPLGSLPIGSHIYGVILDSNLRELERFYLNEERSTTLPSNQTYYFKIVKIGNGIFNGSLKMSWYKNNSQNGSINKKTGTLRVKKIVLNSINGKSISRIFEYKDPITNYSSGVNHGDELMAYAKTKRKGDGQGNTSTCEVWTLSNNSGINLNSVNGKSVGYDFVREIYVDENNVSNNFNILTEFKNGTDSNMQTLKASPLVPREDYSFLRGLVLSKKHIDNSNQVKRIESHEYEFDNFFNKLSSDNYNDAALITALKIDWIDTSVSVTTGFTIKQFYFECKAYDIPSTWVKEIKKTNTDFFGASSVTTTEEFFYKNDHNHIFPEKTKSISSDGTINESNYKYPKDIESQQGMTNLISENRVDFPVEKSIFKNGIQIFSEKTIFDKNIITQNMTKPIGIYAAYLPNSLPSLPLIGQLEKKITYDLYDTKGNVNQYTLESGSPVTYIWGYYKTLPIAKIENATYAQVQQYEANLQMLSNGSDENTLKTALNIFRIILPNALVTTYTHKPLIGVSTITDPKGNTITYNYDAFGRLENVKDKDGNILSENVYHYKP